MYIYIYGGKRAKLYMHAVRSAYKAYEYLRIRKHAEGPASVWESSASEMLQHTKNWEDVEAETYPNLAHVRWHRTLRVLLCIRRADEILNTPKAQYPLTRESTLNDARIPDMNYGMFPN